MQTSAHHATPIASARVEVVDADLPGHCAATSTYVDGVLWLVVDRSKPQAEGHLRELLDEHPPVRTHVLPGVTPRLPRPRAADIGRWAAMAACVITGASAIMNQWEGLLSAAA